MIKNGQRILNMKKLFLALAGTAFLAACQTTTTAIPVEAQSKPTAGKLVNNLQHSRYSSFLKTPMRDFKVDPDFQLVKNVSYFKDYTSNVVPKKIGTIPGARGFYTNYDGDKCVDDLKTLTTVSAMKNYQPGMIVWSNGVCNAIVSFDFTVNPNNNQFEDILLYWAENDVLKNANRLTSKEAGNSSDMGFVIRASVGNMMGHYAMYHYYYDFTPEQHKAVDQMFTNFVKSYNYYTKMKTRGPHFSKLCDVKNPAQWSKSKDYTNDHCGTVNGMLAVGATYYGVEFGNQLVYDYGVRSTEILLGMLSKDKVYASQIGRGMAGMGYADELPPIVDQLDLLYESAFGFDFDEYRNVHGVTPGEVYENLYTVAFNPELMLPYYHKDRDNGASYKGQFLDELKKGNPKVFWGAFNLNRYVNTAPMLGKKYQTRVYNYHAVNADSYFFGMRITGFNPRSVREALKKL